ncbi:MAG: site-specific integrase [Chloroflexi bacterium]|nr:site-specific integrase [Chloroflexota bacterium]
MLLDLELSPLSKRTYQHGINAFIRFLHINAGNYPAADTLDPFPIASLAEETLSAFGRWLREAYPDPRARPGDNNALSMTRTARTYMVAAKRLMNWLDLRELLPTGVSFDRMIRRIDQGRGQRRQGYQQRQVDPEALKVLTHYARQPLPEKPGARRLALLRNRALMAILYDTGMRISEALALTREDVLDGRARKVRLTRTKNGKPRTVFLSEETRGFIRAYTRERDDGAYAPLFVSHGRDKGSALTPRHAWLLVKTAAKAEGLYDNTSPHSLRHRRAQDLLDEGMPLEWVAALLGHQHPDTTRVVYAWQTDEERLSDMVETYGLSPIEASRRMESMDDDNQDEAAET